MTKKTALIIGAGPAGLTAAYELLTHTDIVPIIFEASMAIGGISQTIDYKGNRLDIGGHRFFSKSDTVMEWWHKIMPVQSAQSIQKKEVAHWIKAQIGSQTEDLNPEKSDKIMLVRERVSRIFFLRKFFDYPISLSIQTMRNLGILRMVKIGLSYIRTRLQPILKEKSLEDFFINRFGRELYKTFFKDYTEKVWGVPCEEINPEWGAQRIKGLSITKALLHAVKTLIAPDKSIQQKKIETSLIEQFLYPKFGPGQMWEEVARLVKEKGGQIIHNETVVEIDVQQNQAKSITVKNAQTGQTTTHHGDLVFSTMPIKDLIAAMQNVPPAPIKEVAQGLCYRDFITVGLLLKKMKIHGDTPKDLVPDNWIYIQERDVKIGRLQVFNNWSPYMVKNSEHVWLGLEYFCNEGDELWSMPDNQFIQFAIGELAKIDVIYKEDVLDATLVRMPKTYPAYFGTYDRFQEVRDFTDSIENLFLIGRNGMHRYNNSDHSMLTAITAVKNLIKGQKDKSNIWEVNTEQDYHESK